MTRPRSRLTRRKPRRRHKRLWVELSDSNRRPFPGYEPSEKHGTTYTVSAMGRVYRRDCRHDDKLVAVGCRLTVKLERGGKQRSLPLAVLRAFGHVPPDYAEHWCPWVDPDGPLDPLTSRLRCSIVDIRIAAHSEVVRFNRGGPKPSTFYPIL